MTLNTNSGDFDNSNEQLVGKSHIQPGAAGSSADIKTLLSNFAELNGHILDLSINPGGGSKTLLVSFAEFNESVIDLGITPQEALDILTSYSETNDSKNSTNKGPENGKALIASFAKFNGKMIDLGASSEKGNKDILSGFARLNDGVLNLGMTPQEALEILTSYSQNKGSKSSMDETPEDDEIFA